MCSVSHGLLRTPPTGTKMKQTFLGDRHSLIHLGLFLSLFAFFIPEHLKLLYRPINAGRVEIQVSFF